MKKATGKYIIGLVFIALAILETGCGRPLKVKPDEGASFSGELEFQSLNENIFAASCVACHSNMSTYAGLMASGMVVAKNPEASSLYTRVANGSMPKGGPVLSEAAVKAIYDWIAAGAPEGREPGGGSPMPSPSPTTPASTPEPTYSWLQAKLFNARCTTCHSGPWAAQGLDLSTYDGVRKSVVANNFTSSTLYIRINDNSMPPGGPAITADVKLALATWIQNGALNDVPPTSCSFNGQSIALGGSVTAYQASSVPFGQTCTSQIRNCTNGVLSGTYTHASCAVAPAAACSFNGLSVAHGQNITSYQAASVPFGQTCTSQVRTCNNGTLSGTYTNSSCTVTAAASCSFNGQSIAHSQNVTAFQNSTVPSGQTCTSQVRTCNNGTLSGTYTFASCTVIGAPPPPPQACQFNGQSIASGQTVTAYQAANVPYGQTCTSQVRTCTNGTLSGTYTNATCTVAAAADCTFNGQSVIHNQSVTAYLAASVPSGQTCTSQTRTCNNGTLSGTYTNAICTVAPPVAAPTFTEVMNTIIGPRCTSCHGSGGSGGVSLNTYTNVMRQVRAGNATGSPLYQSVQNNNMPASGAALTAAQKKMIFDWINAGALNN